MDWGGRSPQDIIDAVSEIDPQNNPDLQPLSDGTTFCNVFMNMLMDKLGVPFAPWGQWGALANNQIAWVDAANGGWYPVASAQQAIQLALQGKVVIATYYNINGHGHLAIVLPVAGSVPEIAQAGSRNYNEAPITWGFGNIKPIFYAHD